MSSLRPLLFWIGAGFLLCTWEAPMRSLGMPFNNKNEDVHKPFRVEGDEQKAYEVEGERQKTCVFEDDGDKTDKIEDERHKHDENQNVGFEEDGDEAEGDYYDEHEIDGNEDCTPPTDSSAPTGLRGYRRYFANDSLIGRPVPCTRDDKICFRHNLVFDPISDRCRALLEPCGYGKTITVVIGSEHGSGRVVGNCPMYADPCPGHRMAYDGLCYREKIVRDVICGCNATLSPHILGGMECREEPLSPISVQQPEEDGSCVVPDLHNPDPRSSMSQDKVLRNEYRKELKCKSDQAACFSEGNVFVEGHEGCHTLLEQGPCAEDHVVVLDLQAATQGRAEGTCVDDRGGCPKGYKRMLFDGQCHEDRLIKLVAPGVIVLDVFGRYFPTQLTPIRFRLIFNGNSSCRIDVKTILDVPHSPIKPALPPCGPNNSGECKLHDVENAAPKPDVNDRK